MSVTPGGSREDLLDTLKRIERHALTAQRSLTAKQAINGVSRFQKIRTEAADAVRRAERVQA